MMKKGKSITNVLKMYLFFAISFLNIPMTCSGLNHESFEAVLGAWIYMCTIIGAHLGNKGMPHRFCDSRTTQPSGVGVGAILVPDIHLYCCFFSHSLYSNTNRVEEEVRRREEWEASPPLFAIPQMHSFQIQRVGGKNVSKRVDVLL